MKILLTGAEGDIAEAVCRIVRQEFQSAEVHGSDITGDTWPVQAGYSAVHRLPRGDDPGYPDAIEALHRAERFDFLVPLTGAELLRFAGETVAVPLLMLRRDLVRIFLDKLDTVDWLREHGLPAPDTTLLENASSECLPLLVKPRRGHGSRGISIIRTERHLDLAKAESREATVAQELLEDDDAEFTCGVFRHAASREIRTITFRRRLAGGLTGRARVEEHSPITAVLRDLAERSDLDGSVNVQLRLSAEGPKIFEINPRFSSTVMMRHRLGFKDVLWSIAGRGGEPPSAFDPPIGARAFRLSREIFDYPT